MSRPTRLGVVLALNLALVAGLVTVGISAHSLGVLAEGADYLADAAAIGVSLLAIWLSHRPPTPTRPQGHARATTVAALVNGGWLLLLSVVVVAGAVQRLATTAREVHALPVIIASVVAAIVMLGGALVLRGDPDDPGGDDNGNLNMQAVLLDTVADAASAAGVAATGAFILITGGAFWLDPAVALVIAAIVAYHAVQLLRRVSTAWRETGAKRNLA